MYRINISIHFKNSCTVHTHALNQHCIIRLNATVNITFWYLKKSNLVWFAYVLFFPFFVAFTGDYNITCMNTQLIWTLNNDYKNKTHWSQLFIMYVESARADDVLEIERKLWKRPVINYHTTGLRVCRCQARLEYHGWI